MYPLSSIGKFPPCGFPFPWTSLVAIRSLLLKAFVEAATTRVFAKRVGWHSSQLGIGPIGVHSGASREAECDGQSTSQRFASCEGPQAEKADAGVRQIEATSF